MKNGIVVEQYKFVYWYIPKVGCTSMKAFCAELEGLKWDHLPLNEIHNLPLKYIDPKKASEYSDYKHFFLMRNPKARLISLYNSQLFADLRTNNHFENGVSRVVFKKHMNRFWGDMTFQDFVYAITSIHPEQADPHFKPQVYLLPNVELHGFTLGFVKNKPDYLLGWLGVDANIKIPHLHSTQKGDCYIDDQANKKIEEYYKDDSQWLPELIS